MDFLKRVEIVVPHPKTEKMIALLEKAKVEGYTVIEKVRGKGNRGTQDGLGLTDAFTNSLIIWYGSASEFDQLQESIRQMVLESGGICAVSDAAWVKK